MYAEFYGLATPPFQLTPDARFFFESTVHRQAMAYVVYGLQHTQGFIVITGEVGTGKTILVNNLLSTIDQAEFITAQIVTSQLTGDDLLHLVAGGFGIAKEGLAKGSLLQRISDFVLVQHRNGKRLLLIVDEAQNLSFEALEELRMLSNFVVDGTMTLQAFLLGQPQFRAILGSPQLEQLRQRVTAAYHLGPLNATETKVYIEHRLRRADWRGDPQFTDECFPLMYRHTGGVPRQINTLCSRLLLHGFLAQLHTFTPSTIDKVANELREEIAGVASAPAVVPAGAEKPAVGGGLPGPKLSLAPRRTSPTENAPAPPSLPWWKSWKEPTENSLARASIFIATAALLLVVIVATHAYFLATPGALPRNVAEASQSRATTAKLAFVENSSTLQPIIRPDRLSQQPPEAARAMLAPAEDQASPQAVSPTAGRDPGQSARAPLPVDGPAPVRDTTEQQAPASDPVPSATQVARLPDPSPPVDSPTPNPQQAASQTASPTASPPPARSSASHGLSPIEIAALVTRGDSFLGAGDIASAQLLYERAADAGSGPAALRLGATFDPGFLSRAGIRGIRGDPRQAAFWYRRARDLGDAPAEPLNDLDPQHAAEPNSPR